MDAHFDDSLQTLARSASYLVAWGAALVLAAIALFVRLDRDARRRWQLIALRVQHASLPYRSASFVASHRTGAPTLVRAAALSCFAFGQVFVPGLVFALTTFRFDGIGVALIPGVAIAFANWCCGILLVRRSPVAPEIVRAAGRVSLVMNVALLVLSVLHLAVVDVVWGGTVHECSASVALTALIYAAVSVPQALLMLAAVRSHEPAFQ